MKKGSAKFIFMNCSLISVIMLITIGMEFLGIIKLKKLLFSGHNIWTNIMILWIGLFSLIMINSLIVFIFSKRSFEKLIKLFLDKDLEYFSVDNKISNEKNYVENDRGKEQGFANYKPKKVKV